MFTNKYNAWRITHLSLLTFVHKGGDGRMLTEMFNTLNHDDQIEGHSGRGYLSIITVKERIFNTTMVNVGR